MRVLRTIWMALALLLFLGSGALAAQPVSSHQIKRPKQRLVEKYLPPVQASAIRCKPPLPLDAVPVTSPLVGVFFDNDLIALPSAATPRSSLHALAPTHVRSPRAPPALCLLRLFL
ncbi:hypothetical protein [Armatimonas rosea]|uniref:Uncharacterized protein n=1 Tax=Armatimonas rosea TaxID=685828 RepID=A0A7W9SN36_ARMRO|nr:hypothetical protein [Armatimonas rosea]MBB6049656.1 hypothetical protein [Armatimonas rosea]